MKIGIQLKIMIASLRKTGMRAGLAVACVALGIAAVMITLALGYGAEGEMRAIADKAGKNVFVIKTGLVQVMPGRGQGWLRSTKLRPRDDEIIVDRVAGITQTALIVESNLKAKFGDKDVLTNVRGVSPDYAELRNFHVKQGRMFDEADGRNLARVAVVGSFVADKIGGGSLVGETIWIAKVPYEVIGQFAEKGVSSDGTNEDDQILVPVGTALKRMFNVDYVTSILVQAGSQELIPSIQRQVKDILRETHRIGAGGKDDFEVLSLIKANEVKAMSTKFLKGISTLFAAITLSTGGAGVFAVTLLNVRDRTWEIGLRMAIGARRQDIAVQFIAEACLLSLTGGVVGVALGIAGVLILRNATEWEMVIGMQGVLLPFLISGLMGLTFGVIPAVKASRAEPADALRMD